MSEASKTSEVEIKLALKRFKKAGEQLLYEDYHCKLTTRALEIRNYKASFLSKFIPLEDIKAVYYAKQRTFPGKEALELNDNGWSTSGKIWWALDPLSIRVNVSFNPFTYPASMLTSTLASTDIILNQDFGNFLNFSLTYKHVDSSIDTSDYTIVYDSVDADAVYVINYGLLPRAIMDILLLVNKNQLNMKMDVIRTCVALMVGHFIRKRIFVIIEDNDTFVWTDNTPVDYQNWAAGEPNTASKGYCAYMIYNNQAWYTMDCSANRDFVCKKSPNINTGK
uniref:C-type lectin domain-containing protein n=1 Tax=Acrobeloides nanus TaxID=290746 RepID=A0A914EGN1_9BILA